MPRLKALNRYWKKHPPVHLLVASYLDYEPPVDHDTPLPSIPDTAAAEDSVIEPRRTPWMAGMGSLPPSDAFRAATSAEETLAAAERMFYGQLKEF